MDIKFTTRPVQIYKYEVAIENEVFDFNDLFELMSEIECGTSIAVEPEIGKRLQALGILKSLGSRGGFPAFPGPKFDEVYERLGLEA